MKANQNKWDSFNIALTCEDNEKNQDHRSMLAYYDNAHAKRGELSGHKQPVLQGMENGCDTC